MKKLLLTSVALTALFGGSAFAADLRPAYKAAPLPPPVYSWTGIYWGVNVGYSWGEAKNARDGRTTPAPDPELWHLGNTLGRKSAGFTAASPCEN